MEKYSQLQAQLTDLIRREEVNAVQNEIDTSITTDYRDVWIERAVRRFYNSRAADTQPFRATATGTLLKGTNTIPIPNGFNSLRRITVTNGNDTSTLQPIEVDFLLEEPTNATVTLPGYVGKEGFNFYTQRPATDVTYTIYFYRFLDPVKDVDDTYVDAEGNIKSHWLLNNAGEVLMYWAAVEAAKYYGGDMFATQAPLWEASAADQINEIITRSRLTEASGSRPTWIVPSQYSFPGGSSRFSRRSRR